MFLGFVTPSLNTDDSPYAVGLGDDYRTTFAEHFFTELPWSIKMNDHFMGRWRTMDEVMGHVDLEKTEFYANWLRPQGLACHWPAGFNIANPDVEGEVAGGFSAFRREGQPPFTEADFAGLEGLTPHLHRAVEIYRQLHGADVMRRALNEAVDRLPVGLLLLDVNRNVVVENKSARAILESDDGLHVDRHGPGAAEARENAELQRLLAEAIEAQRGQYYNGPGFVSVSRPSGERAYAVMVTPLLAGPGPQGGEDAVVAVFVTDPSAKIVAGSEALEVLYQLTYSEAELVRLLSLGMSLDEAASQRGVSLNTARSHLKRAFSKTGTNRQGELVHLIVSGVGQIGEG
ncbi:MAG: helix-turn-helix transcriptional regulator [Myxococcota bacterium]